MTTEPNQINVTVSESNQRNIIAEECQGTRAKPFQWMIESPS